MASGLSCPQCGAPWNGQDHYCDVCGHNFQMMVAARNAAGRLSSGIPKPVERIDKPAPRQTNYRSDFEEQGYWVAGAVFIVLSIVGYGIHLKSVKDANTIDGRFGEEQLVNLPWYYDSPVLGAISIGGLSSLVIVALCINILKAGHYAHQNYRTLADLSSQVHHTAWSLQAQIDEVKAKIDRE